MIFFLMLSNQARTCFKCSNVFFILEINESDPSKYSLNFSFSSNMLKEIDVSHFVSLKISNKLLYDVKISFLANRRKYENVNSQMAYILKK